MATQIRKFEQDAIVDTIVDTVKENLKEKSRDMVSKDKTYASMLSNANEVKAIDKQILGIKDKRDKLADKIATQVHTYNAGCDTYELDFNRYNAVIRLDLTNKYKIRRSVTNQVAIALLPKDSIENMVTIIDSIVRRFV